MSYVSQAGQERGLGTFHARFRSVTRIAAQVQLIIAICGCTQESSSQGMARSVATLRELVSTRVLMQGDELLGAIRALPAERGENPENYLEWMGNNNFFDKGEARAATDGRVVLLMQQSIWDIPGDSVVRCLLLSAAGRVLDSLDYSISTRNGILRPSFLDHEADDSPVVQIHVARSGQSDDFVGHLEVWQKGRHHLIPHDDADWSQAFDGVAKIGVDREGLVLLSPRIKGKHDTVPRK